MADSGDILLTCHACRVSWMRDSHDNDYNNSDSGLLCPNCGSDFVQIIAESLPPERDALPRASSPSSHINPLADHNPWEEDSPHRGSAAYNPMDFGFPHYSHHTYRSPDGRFAFSGTTIRGSFPPRQGGAYSNPMVPMLQTLQTILGDITDNHDNDNDNHQHHRQDHPHQEYGNRSPRSEELPHRYSPDRAPTGIDFLSNMERDTFDEPHPLDSRWSGSTQFDRPRPPDTDRPARMALPIESLADLLGTFHYTSEARRRGGRPGLNQRGPDPAMMLSALLRMGEMRDGGRLGDAVYSREALEEVINQLGQQDPGVTGPPPASNETIRSLPKKKVDKQMLGSDGKAECAICKDMVELGVEVTMLPCEHWFHYECIEAWLSRHNSCPNCRQSIDSAASPVQGSSDQPPVTQDVPEQESSGRRRRRSSPFSRSSRSDRSSLSRSSANSPTQEGNDTSRPRRTSRSEGHHRGGITGWVWSRFGGGSG